MDDRDETAKVKTYVTQYLKREEMAGASHLDAMMNRMTLDDYDDEYDDSYDEFNPFEVGTEGETLSSNVPKFSSSSTSNPNKPAAEEKEDAENEEGEEEKEEEKKDGQQERGGDSTRGRGGKRAGYPFILFLFLSHNAPVLIWRQCLFLSFSVTI